MFTSVAQANAAVIEQIRRARPHWLDVQPASSLISELNEGKTLLHAGPPMRWQEMTGPMKGACVGACLFEGWAKDEAQALAILEQGEVNFITGAGGSELHSLSPCECRRSNGRYYFCQYADAGG